MANKIIHKHSSVITDGQAKLPEPIQLDFGELAVNYAAGVETISLKNTEGQIVEFKSTKHIEDIIIDNEYVTANSLTNLDSRVTALEEAEVEIDLSAYATKEELNDYATREELLTTDARINKNEIVTAGALTDLDERIIDLNNCVNDLDDRIDNLSEVADSLDSRITITKEEITNSLTNLDSRVTTLEEAEVEIDLSAYATKEELETLETTFTDNEFITAAALTELNKRVETVELTTSNLNEQIPVIANKQDLLVAGENIKTINGETLLGSGDISIDTTFLTPISYAELVELRNNNSLISGMWYRITDYNTVVTSASFPIGGVFKSVLAAGHQFDIIVLATSTNILSEEARAIQHEGDEYFNDSNLEAWKIWYSLDNDVTIFTWADSENGKGVIYRMIDEHGNDCPYDFKNIQFKRKLTNGVLDTENGVDTWCYTFNAYCTDDANIYDASVIARKEIIDDDANRCYGNIIKEYYGDVSNQGLILNDIVFLNIYSIEDMSLFHCHSNSFRNNCYNNSFGKFCSNNSFGDNCYNNSFGNSCNYNSFGNYCRYNSFGDNCNYNSFGIFYDENSFGDDCFNNSFGNDCEKNSFGNSCNYNSFGNYCRINSFGNYCRYNSFGNGCQFNSFRNSASETGTLKDYCMYNHFDDGCSYNVIWNGDPTSSSINLKNVNVNRGVCSTSASYNMINIDVLNQDYETKVAKNSAGEIKVYCEADLIN